MTTTTGRFEGSRRCRSGFTLVEVLLAMVLGTVILTVAGSAILSIARGSQGLLNYTEMNTRSRQALSQLATTMRSGSEVLEASGTRFSFRRLTETDTEVLTYIFDPDARALLLEREDGSVVTILRDVNALSFHYLTYLHDPTTKPLEIKHVQLEAELSRKVLALTNRNYLISARFMLRNKRVNDS